MGGCLSTNRDQGSGRNRNNRRRRRIPPGERLNKPLKRPIWTHDVEADGPPPSITSLQRERDDFWFTRVTGRPEIWSVIKRVCEMLMTDDSDQQLANAREMLRVAEITLIIKMCSKFNRCLRWWCLGQVWELLQSSPSHSFQPYQRRRGIPTEKFHRQLGIK